MPDTALGKQVRCKKPECQHTFTVSPAAERPAEAEVPIAAPPLPDRAPQGAGDGPPSVSPPPVPPTSERSGQPSPEEILAGYQRTSKPAGPGVKQRLKLGVDSVKKRARAVKLRHDTKNLQTAIDGQQESLGALTLQHRPSEVDISPETAELSQIQEDLAQKQATRQTLRETKGSGSAVKELDREMAKLRDRQRELMIAIGRKAEAAKADMPGAAGHYSGIEQLRSSLAARETEVKSLEEQIGPILEGQGPTSASLKKPLIIGGGVLAGIVVLWLLWTLLASVLGDGLGWARIPGDTSQIAYVNVEKLEESDLSEDIFAALDFDDTVRPYLPDGWKADDLRQFVLVTSEESERLAILRARQNLSLDDIAAESDQDPKIQIYREKEYLRIRSNRSSSHYLGRVGKAVYYVARSEPSLKHALRSLDRDEEAELDEDLREAVGDAAAADYLMASLVGDGSGPLRGLTAIGSSGRFRASTWEFEATFVFRNERRAEDCEEDLEEAIAKEDLDMLEGLKVRRSGKIIRLNGSCFFEDADDLKEGAKQVARLIPSAFG